MEYDCFTTLGITFSSNYNLGLHTTWARVVEKIKNRIQLIRNNFYSIYQKSSIVNSVILSKLWYIAHIYPLPCKYSNQIKTEISNFIWKPRYNPISRKVLSNPKLKGGIGLIDHQLKAKCLFYYLIYIEF